VTRRALGACPMSLQSLTNVHLSISRNLIATEWPAEQPQPRLVDDRLDAGVVVGLRARNDPRFRGRSEYIVRELGGCVEVVTIEPVVDVEHGRDVVEAAELAPLAMKSQLAEGSCQIRRRPLRCTRPSSSDGCTWCLDRPAASQHPRRRRQGQTHCPPPRSGRRRPRRRRCCNPSPSSALTRAAEPMPRRTHEAEVTSSRNVRGRVVLGH
jgi:hypothetical protein